MDTFHAVKKSKEAVIINKVPDLLIIKSIQDPY